MSEALRVERLSRAFDGTVAVWNVSLSLMRGELLCLLGPSGCGKTTLLRLVGGYLAPDEGSIHLAGQEITAFPPEHRDIGMVFQHYALFPHLTAWENVAFGLRVRRVPKGELNRRVEHALDWVGFSAAERRRRPRELSGGQQQRVALARALVIEPKLLMLDEPFANLDRELRERLREELRDIQRAAGVATLLVTHDREEALSLADRVGVMQAGQILQVGPPRELYGRPRNPFVARFLGQANLFQVAAVHALTIEITGGISLSRNGAARVAVGDWVLVRSERCTIKPSSFSSSDLLSGRITRLNYVGSYLLVDVEIGDKLVLQVRTAQPESLFERGDQVKVRVPVEAVRVIPAGDTNRGTDISNEP